MPGRTASGSLPRAQSPREPSRIATPDDGYVVLPSAVEQRSATPSVIRGNTCDWVYRECAARSAAIVFTQGMPWCRARDFRTSSVLRALLKPSEVSGKRRFTALGSYRAYAVVVVHGSGAWGPIALTTGP